MEEKNIHQLYLCKILFVNNITSDYYTISTRLRTYIVIGFDMMRDNLFDSLQLENAHL